MILAVVQILMSVAAMGLGLQKLSFCLESLFFFEYQTVVTETWCTPV